MRTILLLAFIATLASCEKDDNNQQQQTQSQPKYGNVTLFTTSSSHYNLILDGVEYGQIKKATQTPVCGDNLFQNFSLTYGNHVVDAKSTDGNAWGNPHTINVSSDCITFRLP